MPLTRTLNHAGLWIIFDIPKTMHQFYYFYHSFLFYTPRYHNETTMKNSFILETNMLYHITVSLNT